MYVLIHGKKVYCSLCVSFPITEKGLYTPSEVVDNWKHLRKITFSCNISASICATLIRECRLVNLAIFCSLQLKKSPFFLIPACIIQLRWCVKIPSFGANHLRFFFCPFGPYFIDSYSHLRKLAMCTLSHVAKLFERILFSSKRTYKIFCLRVHI